MGYEKITTKPAILYTVVLALYASLVAPFVGFFASGFKRATGIKDFADTLPGHGGLIDRIDCISIMCFFNYFFMKSVVLRDEFFQQAAYEKIQNLQDTEQLLIANTIAGRFGLSPLI